MIFIDEKNVEWQNLKAMKNIAAIKDLANNMKVKLDEEKPFGIKPDWYSTSINVYKKHVIFGETLLDDLNEDEQKNLAAHEFSHLKYHHFYWIIIVSFGIYAIVSLVLAKYVFPNELSLFIGLIPLFAMFIMIGKWQEYQADMKAVSFTKDKKSMLSLLDKLYQMKTKQDAGKLPPPTIMERVSRILHPSLVNRIRRIEKQPNLWFLNPF